jgi:hypothetical protein
MLDQNNDSSAHQLVAVCPAWPQRAVQASVASHHFIGRISTTELSLHTTVFSAAKSEVHSLQSSERLHPKRGPPADSSAIA